MRRIASAVFLILLPFFWQCGKKPDTGISFRLPSGEEKILRLSDPENFAVKQVAVWDPYENRPVMFRAIPAETVLDSRLGESWRQADEILFTCLDGYRAAVPVERFRRHHAFFAVSRNGTGFHLDKISGEKTERVLLSPAYLIWENIDDKIVRSEGDFGWPYQISRVEGVILKETIPDLLPAETAPEDTRRGFQSFRRYCFTCHKINGSGGSIGPELNRPVNVTEYFREEWLLRWVLNPSSVRRPSAMPAILPGSEEEKKKTAMDIIAYLKHMKTRKKEF